MQQEGGAYHKSPDIDFKIKILDALSVVNVRRVRLPPSGLPKIFILKPIVVQPLFVEPMNFFRNRLVP